jgi:hypothetical protein
MRSPSSAALAFVALVGCAAPAVVPPKPLPLRTLRLYETGVGYFERSGALPSAQEPGLPVPAGHLDDALKTLVVLTPGAKARIDGVEFGSSLSHGMARAMAGLPLDADAPVTYESLLGSLLGSMVAVKTPRGPVTGRLVHVESASDEDAAPAAGGTSKPDKPQRREPKLRLTLLSEHAEVVVLDGHRVESVRPLDPAQAARLDAALESLLAQGGQSRHALRLLGEPGAPVTLGYIAETPVWRTTYRLVLPREGRATLQGWALLHNDTDEDWRDVHVELVNGRPDSFLFPLAAPRYARRELVTPQNELSTVPQLMGRTADTLWGDHVGDAYGAGGLGLTGVGEGGGGRGEGIGLGRIGTIGHGAGTGSSDVSSLLAVGDLAGVAKATGVEAGALFVYSMPTALALRAHASALVPFLSQGVDAAPIAWVDSRSSAPARCAIRFVNTTPQTLPAGTLAVFSDGGFAGESSLDRLKPGERRFITYGADLDVEAEQARAPGVVEKVQRLTFAADRLTEHFLRTTDAAWRLENRSGQPRSVYVALALSSNATLTGADAVDYDAESAAPLVVFELPARTTRERRLTSVEGLSRTLGDDERSSKRLAELGALPDLTPADKAAANEASARQKDLEDTRAELATGREEMARVEKDLARLRDDAKAVGDRGTLAQPLVTRIVAAEDKVGALRKRLDALEKEAHKRAEAVRQVLSRLARG